MTRPKGSKNKKTMQRLQASEIGADTQTQPTPTQIDKAVVNGNVLFKSEISRDAGNLLVFLQVHECVEEFFKNIRGGSIKTSESFKDSGGRPMSFYAWENPRSLEAMSDIDIFFRRFYNEYGSAPIRTNPFKTNISLIRTVGLSKGMTFRFKNEYSEDSIVQFAKELKDFVRTMYVQYMRKVNIKTVMTVEEST